MSREVDIREGTEKDLEELQDLCKQLSSEEEEKFDPTIDPEYPFSDKGREFLVARIEEEDGCALVAEKDGQVIGYLLGGIRDAEEYRKLSSIASLESMYVIPDHRGEGIGTELCDRFKEWCSEKGIDRLRVLVTAQNERAIDFYRKRGFGDYSLTMEQEP